MELLALLSAFAPVLRMLDLRYASLWFSGKVLRNASLSAYGWLRGGLKAPGLILTVPVSVYANTLSWGVGEAPPPRKLKGVGVAVPKKPLLVESNGMGVAEEALKVGTGVGVTLGVTLRLSFENRLPKKEFPKKKIWKNLYFFIFWFFNWIFLFFRLTFHRYHHNDWGNCKFDVRHHFSWNCKWERLHTALLYSERICA